MTKKEALELETKCDNLVDIAAVKMLLGRIQEDYDRDLFEKNYDRYLSLYKSMKDWLNSEVEK